MYTEAKYTKWEDFRDGRRNSATSGATRSRFTLRGVDTMSTRPRLPTAYCRAADGHGPEPERPAGQPPVVTAGPGEESSCRVTS